MRRALHLARHDSRLFLLARENFFFMFIMPVLFMVFFSVVLRGGGREDVMVSLQVVNEDDGFLSGAFVRQLQAEHFEVQVLTAAQADTTQYVRRLVIPAGFTGDILARRQVDLRFTKKSDSNIQYDAAAEVRLRQAQAAFLGALILWDEPALADSTPSIPSRERLAALLAEPRLVTVEARHAGRGRPVPTGGGQSVPGMLTMFVLMIVMIGGSETLTREKRAGTLGRLGSTVMSRGEILAGKLLHLVLVGFVQAAVLMAAGQLIGAVRLFGIEFTWGPQYWAVILFLVPFAFTVAGITLFLGGIFRTTQQAESLAWLAGMVLAALGGCWWPLEIMPRAAQILGMVFPTYWAMQALHAVVTFGRGIEGILLPSLVLTAYGLFFCWLGSRTMRVDGHG